MCWYLYLNMKSKAKGMKGQAVGGTIAALVGVVIVILVATALLPTIYENTDEATDSGGDLENLSSSSKTIIDLVPLMFGVGLLMMAVVFAVGRR